MSNDPCKHQTNGGPQFCIRCLKERGDDAFDLLTEVYNLLTLDEPSVDAALALIDEFQNRG